MATFLSPCGWDQRIWLSCDHHGPRLSQNYELQSEEQEKNLDLSRLHEPTLKPISYNWKPPFSYKSQQIPLSLICIVLQSFHFSFSCIGEGNGNPPQCSCLENPRDGGAWWAAVYGVAQSRTRLTRLSSSNSSKGKYQQQSKVLMIPTLKFALQGHLHWYMCWHSLHFTARGQWYSLGIDNSINWICISSEF